MQEYLHFHGLTLTAINSGDRIAMTTNDPVKLPLPSWDLLDMQWVLQRLSTISGAGEPQNDWYDDSSDVSADDIVEAGGEVGRDVLGEVYSAHQDPNF
jgi:hypothetical protein